MLQTEPPLSGLEGWGVEKEGLQSVIGETRIQEAYDRVLDYCQNHDVPDYMIQLSTQFRDGSWRMYLDNVVKQIPVDWRGKTVVDFGCKFGHFTPLLFLLGVGKIINIDVDESYLDFGRAVFGQIFDNVTFLRSEMGYIPLQPETADVVILNEVISHISPTYLDTVYMETSRILRIGGVAFISDGNNLACRGYFKNKLGALYESWEHGPDGTKTDRDTVTRCYLSLRNEMIRKRWPNLGEDAVDHLARNTSGLFGSFLEKVIDAYVETGTLIRRPYRRGTYPTNPGPSGVVMERGFYPVQVELALRTYGFECSQVFPKPSLSRTGLVGRLKDVYRVVRYHAKNTLKPGWQSMESEGFQIIGIKRY